jgi:hypothetical protein
MAARSFGAVTKQLAEQRRLQDEKEQEEQRALQLLQRQALRAKVRADGVLLPMVPR